MEGTRIDGTLKASLQWRFVRFRIFVSTQAITGVIAGLNNRTFTSDTVPAVLTAISSQRLVRDDRPSAARANHFRAGIPHAVVIGQWMHGSATTSLFKVHCSRR